MIFRQIKGDCDNFSYIVADEHNKQAAIIDTSYNSDELARIIKAQKLSLQYIINTHGHSDHTAGNSGLRAMFGAKIVGHELSKAHVDIKVDDGDLIKVGNISIQVIYTPGHTVDGICLLVEGKKLLTGDTLFVGECGRTDLAGGNAKSLYDSLFSKLLKLGGDVEVYPGHDYGEKPSSTIAEQKETNYVLKPRSQKEFVDFMNQP